MPLLLSTHPFQGATFGLWQIAEEEAFFRGDLPLSAAEEQELALHQNPLRRLEWLAGRWLLHKMTQSPQRLMLSKDAFSKPFFPENEHLACSLSHSKGHVGALIVQRPPSTVHPPPSTVHRPPSTVHRTSSTVHRTPSTVHRPPSTAIGCDIQVLTEKMRLIAHKFLNESEKQFVESRTASEQLDLLHLVWTAKESLYKAYGLKELDFKKHLMVGPVSWDGQSGHGVGRVEKGDYHEAFELTFGKTELPTGAAMITAVCWQSGG